MATKKDISKEQPKPAATAKASTHKPQEINWLFGNHNAYIFLAGIVVLIIGFLCMMGGHQQPNQWNEDEIYSFRRVTLSSILVIAGFSIVVVAIVRRPKE